MRDMMALESELFELKSRVAEMGWEISTAREYGLDDEIPRSFYEQYSDSIDKLQIVSDMLHRAWRRDPDAVSEKVAVLFREPEEGVPFR